jgi:hypothetical protein
MQVEPKAETGWRSSVLKGGGTEFVILPLGSSARSPSHEPHEVDQAGETADHSHGHANHDYGGLSKRNIAHTNTLLLSAWYTENSQRPRLIGRRLEFDGLTDR